nr:MAG TPA: hypothetical protein [Caudoviricetes sp.]
MDGLMRFFVRNMLVCALKFNIFARWCALRAH